ncbi:putative transpeptidase [Nostocoides japonicum T1-X7]|uniref:Putative transpeptidase n=1 Tax=Nostocoides japonicum T1-X7 TaxID=1194083 RepID=A0A077LVX3_9MICO|nr:transglycosylase domain-containing protein [Tetrasphaera japonica]CCH77851.1 putative transpeptidase [Tetrasphaera japonica T1-X7]
MIGKMAAVGNVLRLLAAFVVLAVVAGVLAAGLAIPAVGATGSTVKGGVSLFNELPGDLTQSPLNQQSRILDAKGGVIATPYSENRIIVPLKRIAPIMQKAQIAIEDSRFYEHGGVDVRGLSRALVSTVQGDKQGASTLTQQYVKMTLQENALQNDDQEAAQAAVARSGIEGISRKLQELKYAVKLEQTLTKDQILEGYLNLAYYGDLAYGVEAAAEHYFSTSAAKLNYNQAALLAGLVQQPGVTDPVHYPKAAQARRDVVLDRMAQLGVITAQQATAAKKVPVKSMLKVKPAQNTCQRSSEPYFCTYIIAWLQQQKVLGADPAERLKNLNTKGLTIQTTLDPSLSDYITKTLRKKVWAGDPSGVGAAATIIQPGTGKVLAMGQTSKFPVGNQKGKAYTQQNWNVDAKYGGSTYGFQIGSTAKMYILADALSNGIPVNGSVYAKAAGPSRPAYYSRSDNSDSCKDWQTWPVRNDSNWGGGPMSLWTATGASVNSAFASLTMKLGVCHVIDTMTKMGLHMGNGAALPKYPTMALGAGTISPMTVASGYATIASGGIYCQPTPVVSITDSTGKKLPLGANPCKRVLDKDVAAGVAQLLKAPLTMPGGTATGLGVPGRPSAGKTGTTDSHVQTWFAGITPQLATAVWVGTGIGTGNGVPSTPFSMAGKRIGGIYRGNVFGADIAAPLWQSIMTRASKGMPVEQFPKASSKVTNGDYVKIPYVVGMSTSAAKAAIEDAGFDAYNAGQSYSTYPAGTVAGTTPSGSALRGSSVGYYISTGYVPKPPKPPATQKTKKKPSSSSTSKKSEKPKKSKPKPKPTKTHHG